MAGGNIRAGGAFVEIFGKDMLDKSLKAAAVRLKAFGATVTAIGAGLSAGAAVAAAPLGAMVKTFIAVGDQAQKAALRTGTSSNAISELGYAAQQSGASMADIEKGIRTMQMRLVEASEGSRTATNAFNRLGLSIKDLDGLSPDKQFELIASRLDGIQDPAIKAATAMELFGRGNTRLLPLIAAGADGIRQLREEAVKVGASIDQGDADAAAALGDAWARVTTSLKGAAVQVGAALAPVMTRLADVILGVTNGLIEFTKNNRDTIAAIGQGIAVAAAAGVAFTALGVAISAVGAIVGNVPALVAVAAASFIAFTQTGRQLAANLLQVFQGFGQEIAEVFAIVRDLILAGDVEQAMHVLWANIKAVFAEGKYAATETWVGFQEILLSTWTNTISTISSVLTKAWAGIKGIFYELRGLIDSSFDVEGAQNKLVADTLTALDAIEGDRQAANNARQQRLLNDLKAAREEAKQAREQRRSAVEDAKQRLGELSQSQLDLPTFEPIDLGDSLRSLDKQRRASEGTFLAAAASRLGGSQDISREQLDVAEEQLEETKRLRKTIEDNPLAFI